MTDSIPLYDGPPTNAQIQHPENKQAGIDDNQNTDSCPIRGHRRNRRLELENVKVCLATHDASGRTEYVDCPVIDISFGGIGLLFDHRVKPGIRCYISYRTRDRRTVNLGGTIRRCKLIETGHFELGIQFDRHLSKDELQPARVLAGASASPLQRGRQLRFTHSTMSSVDDSNLRSPHVVSPTDLNSDDAIDISD